MAMQAVATPAVIANLSLSHLGSTKVLTDFTTGTSVEDKACNLHYALCRDYLLKAANWSFALKRAAGAGQATLTDASPYYTHWAYSYTYPTDCLQMRRIPWHTVRDARIEHRQAQIPYLVDGTKIYTDQDEAVFEYTMQVTTVTLFPVDFVEALSYLLAAKIGPSVTGGDPFKNTEKALQFYVMAKSIAMANNQNEPVEDEEHQSEFIRTRG